MSSEHVSTPAGNTYGTTFDILVRPNASEDMRCNDLITKVAESLLVVFPQTTQQAIEDSIVAAIADASGRFAGVNLTRISTAPNNAVVAAEDGGLFVQARPFASAISPTVAATTGNFTMPLTGFPDDKYLVAVNPGFDPGVDFRWWVTAKSASSVSISFFTTNAVALNVIAMG